MGDVAGLVLDRMLALYGSPPKVKPEKMPAFFQEYQESLGGFSDELLKKGMDHIRDTHTNDFWPTPGVINAACRKFTISGRAIQSKGWDDTKFVPNSEISRENVRRIHAQFKKNMQNSKMLNPFHKEFVPTYPKLASAHENVNREQMAEKERRFRVLEIDGASDPDLMAKPEEANDGQST